MRWVGVLMNVPIRHRTEYYWNDNNIDNFKVVKTKGLARLAFFS